MHFVADAACLTEASAKTEGTPYPSSWAPVLPQSYSFRPALRASTFSGTSGHPGHPQLSIPSPPEATRCLRGPTVSSERRGICVCSSLSGKNQEAMPSGPEPAPYVHCCTHALHVLPRNVVLLSLLHAH